MKNPVSRWPSSFRGATGTHSNLPHQKATMPELITLEEAKAQARIDTDDEDALIQTMVDASIAYVAQAIGADELDDSGPPMAKAAALLAFADLYSHREAQSGAPLSRNKTLDNLLAMCRAYRGFVG